MPPKTLFDRAHAGVDGVLARDIEMHRDGGSAEFARGAFGRVEIDIGDRNPCPFLHIAGGKCLADTACGAGDDGRFADESSALVVCHTNAQPVPPG